MSEFSLMKHNFRNVCDQLCRGAESFGLRNIALPRIIEYIKDQDFQQIEAKFDNCEKQGVELIIVVLEQKNSATYCK